MKNKIVQNSLKKCDEEIIQLKFVKSARKICKHGCYGMAYQRERVMVDGMCECFLLILYFREYADTLECCRRAFGKVI